MKHLFTSAHLIKPIKQIEPKPIEIHGCELTDKSHCCLSIQCLMISMSNVQTSCNVRSIMMTVMVARLMAADIMEVRMTILLSDRHWPLLTLHLILVICLWLFTDYYSG